MSDEDKVHCTTGPRPVKIDSPYALPTGAVPPKTIEVCAAEADTTMAMELINGVSNGKPTAVMIGPPLGSLKLAVTPGVPIAVQEFVEMLQRATFCVLLTELPPTEFITPINRPAA